MVGAIAHRNHGRKRDGPLDRRQQVFAIRFGLGGELRAAVGSITPRVAAKRETEAQ